MNDYLASYETTYSKANGWKLLNQEPGVPAIPRTKISDFALNDKEGAEITDDVLAEEKYTFLVVSWKMPSKVDKKTVVVPDSIFRTDTLKVKIGKKDTIELKRIFDHVGKREEVFKAHIFDADYRQLFQTKINPFLEKAEKAGCKIAAVVPFADPKKLDDFRHEAQSAYPFYTADDLLIKTMMRSNPGIFLLKNGQIVHKWHIKKLPEFEAVQAEYLK